MSANDISAVSTAQLISLRIQSSTCSNNMLQLSIERIGKRSFKYFMFSLDIVCSIVWFCHILLFSIFTKFFIQQIPKIIFQQFSRLYTFQMIFPHISQLVDRKSGFYEQINLQVCKSIWIRLLFWFSNIYPLKMCEKSNSLFFWIIPLSWSFQRSVHPITCSDFFMFLFK